MPRRIDIELTSTRDDGTWTWRAAGAREPRGTVPGSLLQDPKVGDVVKVEAEFFVDGIEITAVVPTKEARKEPERIELIAPERGGDQLVTTTLAPRDRDDRGSRRGGPGRPRRDRADGDRPRDGERRGRDDDRQGRDRGPRREGGDRPPRRTRPEPPPVPVVERPKAKRLRPGNTHRNELLASLPEEQRPIAEQVLLGGLPAVRQAIEKQNAERTAGGEPPITPGPLLDMAEKLLPKARAAEWRDRAEAAEKVLDQLDLRDLRSVVSAAGDGAKDDETRTLAATLKAGLATRVDAEHTTWLEELTANVDVGRIVRALRLSSRPPKAGAPLPADLATRMTDQAGEALTADASPERWVAVLDALAFAPVRDKVIPASLPKELHADVRATIARLATRIPKIAHIFEIEPDRSAPRPKVERRRPAKPKRPPKDDKPKPEAKAGQPAPTEDAVDSAVEETPLAEAPVTGVAESVEVPEAPAAEPAVSEPTPEVAESAAEETDAPQAPAAENPEPEPTPDAPAAEEPPTEEAPAEEPPAEEPAAD